MAVRKIVLPGNVGDLMHVNNPDLDGLKRELSTIDHSAICVNIIGSAKIDDDVESVCRAIGERIAKLNIVLFTGSLTGVQKTIACSAVSAKLDPKRIHHLYPGGKDGENPNVWRDGPEYGCWDPVGKTLEERRKVSATTSKIFILVNGGPGAFEEANWVLNDGGIVLPVARTGGAASGMTFGGVTVNQQKAKAAILKVLSEEDCRILLDRNANEDAVALVIEKAIRNFDNMQRS